jgi:hypothetical protein
MSTGAGGAGREIASAGEKARASRVAARHAWLAVRIDANPPSLRDVSVKTAQGHAVDALG